MNSKAKQFGRAFVYLAISPFVAIGAVACFIYAGLHAGWSLIGDAFDALDD